MRKYKFLLGFLILFPFMMIALMGAVPFIMCKFAKEDYEEGSNKIMGTWNAEFWPWQKGFWKQ